MTDELRQRDLTIDSLKGTLSNITQQLRAELEREKQRAAELQVTLTQLEVVKSENHHLKDLLHQLEIRSSNQEDSSGAALRGSLMSSQSSLEQENEMLRLALTEICAKKSEAIPAQDRIEAKDQKKRPEHVKVLEAKLPDLDPHHEAEILLKKQYPLSRSPSEQFPSDGSPSSSSSSSCSSQKLTKKASLPRPSDTQKGFSSEDLTTPSPLEQLSVLPADGVVTRFLETETILSQELFQSLDNHIQRMKDDNLRTASKCLQRGPTPVSPPSSVQNDK